MGYFHAKRGAEGTAAREQPLEIVHLDISPSNLLVTQDGFLKVIDFGIARARGQRTRTDVLPGKLGVHVARAGGAQARVDHRSDIFSLGIVLYEITVGRRLFRGPAQRGRAAARRRREVEPPTFARRNFPPALESIVMRALEKHPTDRYQSAYDLADDLETFLRDERLHSGPVRIARYLDVLTQAAGGTAPARAGLRGRGRARRAATSSTSTARCSTAIEPSEGAPGPEQAPRVGGRRAARGRRRRGARHGARRAARAAHAGAGAARRDGAGRAATRCRRRRGARRAPIADESHRSARSRDDGRRRDGSRRATTTRPTATADPAGAPVAPVAAARRRAHARVAARRRSHRSARGAPARARAAAGIAWMLVAFLGVAVRAARGVYRRDVIARAPRRTRRSRGARARDQPQAAGPRDAGSRAA